MRVLLGEAEADQRQTGRRVVIALYLLAAHLVGDFVLQTRWQAASKLTDFDHRVKHVGAYTAAFVPVVCVSGVSPMHASAFLVWLFLLHFVTDSRRFFSTLGDWLAWRGDRNTRELRLIPNPWAPIPILIDQSLHVAQIAVLGGIFLT